MVEGVEVASLPAVSSSGFALNFSRWHLLLRVWHFPSYLNSVDGVEMSSTDIESLLSTGHVVSRENGYNQYGLFDDDTELLRCSI